MKLPTLKGVKNQGIRYAVHREVPNLKKGIIRMFYNTISFLTAGNFFTHLKDGLKGFFQTGLGGDGAQGFGIAILVIGFVVAGISFVAHKFNPQSKLPGWITCLVIGVVGAILMGGVEKPMKLFEMVRDTLYGWLGIGGGT